MEKDFDTWNARKQEIHSKRTATFCKEREIWWCAIGLNVGFEQDGTGRNFDRPVIVVRSFSKQVFIGVALTGRARDGRYHFPIGNVDGRPASAVLSQIRLIDTKRLVRKIGKLDSVTFTEFQNRLQALLFQENSLPRS